MIKKSGANVKNLAKMHETVKKAHKTLEYRNIMSCKAHLHSLYI